MHNRVRKKKVSQLARLSKEYGSNIYGKLWPGIKSLPIKNKYSFSVWCAHKVIEIPMSIRRVAMVIVVAADTAKAKRPLVHNAVERKNINKTPGGCE